ncbi:MAG: hypothetical protein H6560_27755 [Lewinellaceae bacterium]|nr:hypothetical protein [Lewinellaceae bacterium]
MVDANPQEMSFPDFSDVRGHFIEADTSLLPLSSAMILGLGELFLSNLMKKGIEKKPARSFT